MFLFDHVVILAFQGFIYKKFIYKRVRERQTDRQTGREKERGGRGGGGGGGREKLSIN